MQVRILEALQFDNGKNIVSLGLNTEDVARAIDVSRPTASKWLAIMEAAGFVKHYDVGRSKLWFKIPEKI
jgi:DNA-binding MarR family transcriptional regulator